MSRLFRFVPLIVKQVLRNRARTIMTVSGVAVAMFLFTAVQSMQAGVRHATQVTAEDTTLVVYRENRYCPFTSRLPQYYGPRIEAIEGVESVVPMRILVSNCRASLDVVTFRGVPEEEFAAMARDFEIVDGSIEEWKRRSDSALVGESLALRRGIKVGQRFSAAGVTVNIAGILRSSEPQDRNVAYTHLAFIQEAVERGGTGGIVTQFNVRVTDPELTDEVAARIDTEFASEQDPTFTRPEKAFVARAATDIVLIAEFAGWLGWGALAAVFALVANAIVMSVQDRVREHAILQTLGFNGRAIAGLIVGEGALLGVIGGAVGAVAAWGLITQNRFTLTMEGQSIEVGSSPLLLVIGFGASVLLGVLASLVPGLRAGRREIASCFRAV